MRDGDEWVLDGAKTLHHQRRACRPLRGGRAHRCVGPPSQGVSLFLVDKGTPGLRVERRLDKMGWKSSDTAQLSFDGCRVPAGALLGEPNRGFAALMRNVQNERLVLAAQALGESQAAIAQTLDYTRLRKAFGAT